MKNLKHTPGDWKVDERTTNGTEGYEIHYNEDGECITDHVYTLADAKLIAAAPELLDLALFVEEFCEMTQSEKRIFLKKLRKLSDKAIKKATK